MQDLTKNKLSVVGLILLFAVPVIVAIVMNSKLIEYSPSSFKNHGDFIQPPIKITDEGDLNQYESFWTVVYQHAGACDKECLNMLDTLYRIRLTRGHKMTKVKLLVLYPEGSEFDIPAQYTSIAKQTYGIDSNLAEILTNLSPLSLGANKGLYLLAPEGFLMMSYPVDFAPEDVIDDLGLLLRARKNEG
ncbi:MAG: hypothetical protein L3J53_06425 [Proteobacteria bacterium]|nr:hypothetical protein [Pseudomonadota bacterium]